MKLLGKFDGLLILSFLISSLASCGPDPRTAVSSVGQFCDVYTYIVLEDEVARGLIEDQRNAAEDIGTNNKLYRGCPQYELSQ